MKAPINLKISSTDKDLFQRFQEQTASGKVSNIAGMDFLVIGASINTSGVYAELQQIGYAAAQPSISIDWSKAPTGTTGAVVADFAHPDGGFGRVEFLPSSGARGKYREGRGSWIYHDAPNGPTWDGEGLPPVGTVCEFRHGCWAPDCWQAADIKYISSVYLIVAGGDFKYEQHHYTKYIQFRPIRTAEQTAADERDKEIAHLSEITGLTVEAYRSVFEKIIDSEYRKQVKP